MCDEIKVIDSIVLVDGCHGIYVPKGFYNRYNDSEYLHNVDAEKMEYIGNTNNMENDDYFDTWASIMDSAYFLVDGKKYSIEYSEYSGDLLGVCYE